MLIQKQKEQTITGLSTSRKLYIREGRFTICAQKFPDDGWISRRWDVGMWTGSGWPRIETGGGCL